MDYDKKTLENRFHISPIERERERDRHYTKLKYSINEVSFQPWKNIKLYIQISGAK